MVSPSDDTRSGSIIFSVGGDDVGAFFPVEVTFFGQGSMAGIDVASIAQTAGGDAVEFSVDSILGVDEYLVV